MKETASSSTNIYDLLKFLIPVFTFFFGLCYNYVIEKKKKRKELVMYKEVTIKIVDLSIFNIEQYIKFLYKLSNDIQSNETFNIIQYSTNDINFEIVNSLSTEKKLNAFLYNIKSNDKECENQIYNYLKQIEFLSSISKLVNSEYDKYFNLIKTYNDNISRLMNDLNLNIAQSGKKYDGNFYRDISVINYMIIKKQNEEELNMKIIDFKNDFLNPIFAIYTQYRMDENILIDETFNIISDINFNIQKITNLKNVAALFRNYASNIENSTKVLEQSNDYFKSKEIRNFWNIQ